MNDSDIITCLIDDLLDRICVVNSSSPIVVSTSICSSKSIENQFQESIDLLNCSIKQLLSYELNHVVINGQLTSQSHTRHSRYYNPTATIKQTNDLRRRLQWVEQRQMLVKQLHHTSNEQLNETNDSSSSVSDSLRGIWFDHRLRMLDNSLQLLKKADEKQKFEESSSCARCRIYRRQDHVDSPLMKKLKHIHRIHREHSYSTRPMPCSTPDSDLILSLARIADRIGHKSNPIASSPLKKVSSSSTTGIAQTKKKQQLSQLPVKFQSSISMMVGDSTRPHKKTLDESRPSSNNNFMSTNFDLTNKRQKRIASPQSTLSLSSSSGPLTSSFLHDILTPSWRLLTELEMEICPTDEKSGDVQENEDISDEVFIRRHIRCELEQESWTMNTSVGSAATPTAATTSTNSLTLSSNRRSSTLQTSLSLPSSLSSTNSKQYRDRLTPNGGITFTETIDTK